MLCLIFLYPVTVIINLKGVSYLTAIFFIKTEQFRTILYSILIDYFNFFLRRFSALRRGWTLFDQQTNPTLYFVWNKGWVRSWKWLFSIVKRSWNVNFQHRTKTLWEVNFFCEEIVEPQTVFRTQERKSPPHAFHCIPARAAMFRGFRKLRILRCKFPWCLFHKVVQWRTLTVWRASEGFGCTVSFLLATNI